MSSTISTASAQWANRPDDERFVDLHKMFAFKQDIRDRSSSMVVPSKLITVIPMDDHRGLTVVGPYGLPYFPTNWAFGQLCERAKSPASYLRTLPAEIAADAINFKLRFSRDIEDVRVLMEVNHQPGANGNINAVTGPNYGRVWDSEIVSTLIDNFGDGVTGTWKVPGEFGKDVAIDQNNTTLYASDRDMFVFLADEQNRIEIPRRGGVGTLARGFFVSNSEVGKRTLTVSTFYFDYVCCNRIVWGAEGFQEIAIRHTVSAPDRWLEDVKPALLSYQHKGTAGIVEAVKVAQEAKITEEIDDFLAKRFSRRVVAPIKAIHDVEEGRPIETLWDAATAVTAYARSINNADRRVELETAAGKILDLAAA